MLIIHCNPITNYWFNIMRKRIPHWKLIEICNLFLFQWFFNKMLSNSDRNLNKAKQKKKKLAKSKEIVHGCTRLSFPRWSNDRTSSKKAIEHAFTVCDTMVLYDWKESAEEKNSSHDDFIFFLPAKQFICDVIYFCSVIMMFHIRWILTIVRFV